MSERMTSVSLLDVKSSGIQDYGLKTAEEMISQIREWAAYNKSIADAILEAKDEDFHVETYLGPWAQKGRKVIQIGRFPNDNP